ncbi:citron Rho-interacting kinase-like isoform X3 [Littorina saxatilis]|uniref:citron Rho-interacting kinase-like isoform X3 n=1 Tax=Littorina saxatilis TaxID=31220 RepID=UPI0038B6914A
MEGEVPAQLQQRCDQLLELAKGDGMAPKLGLDCLMDSFMALFDECQQDSLSRNKNIAAFVKKYREAVKQSKELRIKPSDFEVKATIGRGHFGEVQVVHEKTTDTVYAMKVLRKSDLLSQPDISFFEEERDIMAECNSPWLTKLHFAFQDSVSLYFVMDFHPGGDLLSLLSRHGDQLEEDMARFYLAEMAVAINDLHQMGYLHRDIKPENVLLDATGHIKLADFGSAAKLDLNKQVSSRMPVGTPDYVAPELLDSMNRSSRNHRYGVEVDWWSLGICAYEMLFGNTPFTDEEGSMVATYGNIMNFKSKLKFPQYSSVSAEARDLITLLLTDNKSRLCWPQIQQHPFFKTVSWPGIRKLEPPFIPSISSLDDTSNFDEVEKAKPLPNLESFQPSARDFSGRHLPFVGFTFYRCADAKSRLPKKSLSNTTVLSELDSSVGLNTARYVSQVDSATSLTSPADPRATHAPQTSTSDMEVTVNICEIRDLRGRCGDLEGKVEVLEAEKNAVEKELKEYIAKNQALQQQLEQEKDQADSSDKDSVQAWKDLQSMNSQISSLEDHMMSFQLDELREIIVQLETEQESLTRRLLQKDRQMELLQKTLTTAQQQLSNKQHKLDKERRKSRDGQKQNLALFESHEDSWIKQLEEKQATIDELNRKLRDVEDLVTAYEEIEDEQAGELQQLHYKLSTSLLSAGIDTSEINLDHTATTHMKISPAMSETKRVSLQVTLKPGRRSVRDNKTVEKLKELQSVVDRYSKEASSWRQKEEELQKKISKLKGDLKSQRQKEGVSQKTKESLMTKVHVYQQEVHMQRKLIQELQKKMRSYLDEQTTITQTEAKLKDLQCQNLDLEADLFTVKQEAEQTRQAAMDKTREMEDIIGHLETARRQVQEYQDKYSKEVENTDIKTQELEGQVAALREERSSLGGQVKSLLEQTESLQALVDEERSKVERLSERNTLLNRQLQEFTQRNADLLRQVDSLQKVKTDDDDTAVSSRSELNTQINRLQQHNDDLQGQLQTAQRERRDLEDKTLTLQRDAERLNRRMARLEKTEAEKRELEIKLEKMGSMERDKKRLELRLSRMDDVEQEKAQLQLKCERLEMDARTVQMELREAKEEKKKVSDKYQQLSREHEAHTREKMQQSPSSKKLRLDLIRSEKEQLERQVKELKHLNVSAKELKEELEYKEVEVTDLKAKVRSLEDQVEEKERKTRKVFDLESKVRLLESQVEDRDRNVKEVRELKAKVRSLEGQTEDMEKKVKEVSELKAKVRSLERQVEEKELKIREVSALKDKVQSLEEQLRDSERKAKNTASEGNDREKLAMSAELRDLKSQLRMKSSSVERLEGEKAELQKQITEKKQGLDRTPSVEVRSRLVDRLQTEKADLQRKLEQMEKERDTLQRSRPGLSLRDSGSRNSLVILRESGSKLRADLEDKVQRLERVVRELEKKLEISSATSVDKDMLKHEIEQLRVQIKETAEAEVRDAVPQGEYDSLKDSHEQLQDKVKDLQGKLQQLQDEKRLLEKTSANRTASEGKHRMLELRVKSLEEENSELKGKRSEIEQRHKKLENELESEKKSAKEEIEKLKAGRSTASSNRLVGELTQEKHALESKVKSLERQLESLQKRRQSSDHKNQASTEIQQEKAELEARVNNLTTEITKLKEQKASSQKLQSEAQSKAESLGLQVKDLMADSSKLREEVASLQAAARNQKAAESQKDLAEDWTGVVEVRKTNSYLETKVEELEKYLERANNRPNVGGGAAISRDALIIELRKELHESNLAVSEARSLLAANQRQEKELRDRVEKLQRALDNGAVSRATNIQMAAGAEQELRVLRSQYETLQRQYKNLEDRQNGSHRDKAATVMEVTLLKDQVQTKQHQLDMEIKKSQKLAALCLELEDQVKDMEALVDDSEKQEAQWNDIRQTYEKAVAEREEELEGATQKLHAVSSTRTAVDSRVTELSQELEKVKSHYKAEVATLKKQVEDERNRAHKVTAKMSTLEEKEHKYRQMLEVQGQSKKAESGLINELKEEISSKITEMQDLKATNLKLKKHLDQAMDKFELIFGEKVSLENFTEALQGLHFLEKYKFESTIGQQMKLIDYLQELYMENSGTKKKNQKRFGSTRSKEDHPFHSLPLQWTDLQTALELEQKKTAKLQEQLDRLREENFAQANDLLKLRGPLKERTENTAKTAKALTPRMQNAAVTNIMRSPSAQTMTPHKSGRRGYQVPVQPTPQRMHHNIPHRFVTGLNTRATKCGLCLGSVHFVKQASKCQECGMVVHPKCASSVPATCGLPTEYVRHFADMMSRIEEAEMHSNSEPLNIKMEGWLKVPRTGKPGWEKRWVELDGSYLMLYKEDTDANPVDTFDLSPPDAEVSVHSAVTAAELTNTASLDLYYVLRLDQDPLTTCWPGRYLYLMTTNFSEKQRWVAALEAAVRSVQRHDRLSRNVSFTRINEPQMTTVVSLKESDRKEFNCALALSPQMVLLGTDDGLFALNPQTTSGRQYLVQLSGFGSVHQMAEAKGISMVLLLTGPERRLVMVESKLIKCRMSQTIGGETTPFTYKVVEGIQSCTVFEVAVWADASYLCVGMPDKVVLLKYNPSLAMYCVRKEMLSNQPCSCMTIAESFAIVGTDRFYRISLEHPSLLDFVDRQDSSLAFAAFGAANHHSFPLAVVQVSPEGLPLEFLLCFHEFGVFVDHRGQRSRQSDIKWSGLPLSFLYTEPFLYITYFNSLQATVVPTDKEQVKGCQTAVDLPAPRNLGRAEECGAIYVASSSNGITEVMFLRARDQRKEIFDSDEEKENMTRQVRFAPSPDKNYNGGFTVKTSVSLLSLDSISSASTFTSVESTL